MKRRRVVDSADGLVVDDVIGDIIQSQDSAAIAKRCRLHKLIRQRFALALKNQQEDFALLFQQTKLQWIQSQRKEFQTQCFEHPVARRFRRSFWTSSRKQQQHPVEELI
ncbi:protein GAMETE EXPRESSED 2 [Dorcoceras hygrometricum]|uniref:Protein GAMETE EXPRESSED 2 n=1 Tax=Dorcoceras hygrometricum TaxID=472368 RepID=A0A2Z7D9K9_9LAMI|nr:protein GAMETE EXPRESSED 2 [Dorcoceras hygrometricum]